MLGDGSSPCSSLDLAACHQQLCSSPEQKGNNKKPAQAPVPSCAEPGYELPARCLDRAEVAGRYRAEQRVDPASGCSVPDKDAASAVLQRSRPASAPQMRRPGEAPPTPWLPLIPSEAERSLECLLGCDSL